MVIGLQRTSTGPAAGVQQRGTNLWRRHLRIGTSQVKVNRYGAACKEHEITFFTLGIDAMGRLSDSALSFLRWITNSPGELVLTIYLTGKGPIE